MRNPMPEYVGRGYISILDSIAKKTSCFSHGTSLHQHSFIFTLVSCVFAKLAHVSTCAHAQIYGTAPCHHVLSAVKMASCLVPCCIQCIVARLVITA